MKSASRVLLRVQSVCQEISQGVRSNNENSSLSKIHTFSEIPPTNCYMMIPIKRNKKLKMYEKQCISWQNNLKQVYLLIGCAGRCRNFNNSFPVLGTLFLSAGILSYVHRGETANNSKHIWMVYNFQLFIYGCKIGVWFARHLLPCIKLILWQTSSQIVYYIIFFWDKLIEWWTNI